MAFRIGQRVVCVDPVADCDGVFRIHRGRVYTVEGFAVGWQGHDCLILAEIPFRISKMCGIAYPNADVSVRGYRVGRFRPLTEKKTDISCLTAILDRVNSKKARTKKVEA